MPDFSTDAILLRKIEYGDHDFIISFFTHSQGKVSVIAKNAKKSIRRFDNAFDIFCVNHIQCALQKKNPGGLTILLNSDLKNGFANIRCDLFKTASASFWIEMIYFYLEEKKQELDMYDLLEFSLDALDKGSIPTPVLNLIFQIRFMSLSGFTPTIETCDVCSSDIDSIKDRKIWFDFKQGRILCRNCREKGSGYGMEVSKGTLKQLFWINNNDIKRADRIRFSPFAIKEGTRLLWAFIPFHMGRDFKSLNFLKQTGQGH